VSTVVIEDAPASKRVWCILATSIGTVMSMLDQTIANTALPTIAHDVNATAASSIWVISGYQLGMAIGIVPLAAAADILGYRRLYLGGMIVFMLASLACALSHSLLALSLSRFAQGIAGSMMTVTSSPINRLAYPPEMLGRATGYAALSVALGAAAGPIVSGLVLSVASWQWLFAINIPIGIIAFVFALYGIPRSSGSRAPFDFTSAGLSIITFGLGVFGLDAVSHRTAIPLAVAELTGAAIVGTIFIRRQLSQPRPLFPVDLFEELRFSLAAFACYASFISQTIAYVALPFAFQTVMGYSPLEVAGLLLPWLLAAAAIAPVAGRLADRFNSSRVAGIGLALFTVGLLLVTVLPTNASPFDIMVRMAICGLGYGLFQSPNNRSIQGAAPRERSAAPQAIQSVARLIGQTTGAIAVAIVFGLSATSTHASGTNANAIFITMIVATLGSAAALIATVWRGVLTGSINLRMAHRG
jgi:DHA2 family multidrug resistance protein-like MFS transporter